MHVSVWVCVYTLYHKISRKQNKSQTWKRPRMEDDLFSVSVNHTRLPTGPPLRRPSKLHLSIFCHPTAGTHVVKRCAISTCHLTHIPSLRAAWLMCRTAFWGFGCLGFGSVTQRLAPQRNGRIRQSQESYRRCGPPQWGGHWHRRGVKRDKDWRFGF